MHPHALLTDACVAKLTRELQIALTSRASDGSSAPLRVPLAWTHPNYAGSFVAEVTLPAAVAGEDLDAVAAALAEGFRTDIAEAVAASNVGE